MSSEECPVCYEQHTNDPQSCGHSVCESCFEELGRLCRRTCPLCRASWIKPEDYLAAVGRNGFALEFVPEEHRTPELCLAAVQQDGMALEFVPQEHRTPEICIAAVQQNGWELQFVPEEHRTPELCLVAVWKNRYALQFVPKEFLTPEMIK